MSDDINKIMVKSIPDQNKASELIGKLFTVAQAGSVYSQPVVSGEYTVITASEISVSMGVGFGGGGTLKANTGQTESEKSPDTGEVGGGGGVAVGRISVGVGTRTVGAGRGKVGLARGTVGVASGGVGEVGKVGEGEASAMGVLMRVGAGDGIASCGRSGGTGVGVNVGGAATIASGWGYVSPQSIIKRGPNRLAAVSGLIWPSAS